MLIYDCEIDKGIEKDPAQRLDGIEYCDGWRDFANMGISVIGAHDSMEDRYRVFMKDNFNEFMSLVQMHKRHELVEVCLLYTSPSPRDS